MKKIAIAVCEHYDMLLEDLFDKRKTDELVRVRYMVMYIAYKIFGYSYSEIGRFLKKNHATCLHGINKMKGELDVYPTLKSDFNTIRLNIYSHGNPDINPEKSRMYYCKPCDALNLSL